MNYLTLYARILASPSLSAQASFDSFDCDANSRLVGSDRRLPLLIPAQISKKRFVKIFEYNTYAKGALPKQIEASQFYSTLAPMFKVRTVRIVRIYVSS